MAVLFMNNTLQLESPPSSGVEAVTPAHIGRTATGGLDASSLACTDVPRTGFYSRMKPMTDFVLAALLLVPALPLIMLAALAVKLTSKGPAVYVQTRLGRHGRPFRLYKLRSMRHDCERLTGAVWAKQGDARITPVGHFLRASHFDELPQLFNVLRGEMSLVGPRPERPEIVPALAAAVPRYSERLQVRPGVTGLAQVQAPADTDIQSVRRKLSYDLYYIRRQGLWLDLRLIVCTAIKCLGAGYQTRRRLFALPQPEQDLVGRVQPSKAETATPTTSTPTRSQMAASLESVENLSAVI
jgi:lipopolysaccharide/colanic/teichoic acid biosynthesis glycosyltransferase